MAEYTALAPLFTDIANAIRSKTGETGAITANSFPDKILNFKNILEYVLDSKKGNNQSYISFNNVSYAPQNWSIICFQTYSDALNNALCYVQSKNGVYVSFGGDANAGNQVRGYLDGGMLRISVATPYYDFSSQVDYYLIV